MIPHQLLIRPGRSPRLCTLSETRHHAAPSPEDMVKQNSTLCSPNFSAAVFVVRVRECEERSVLSQAGLGAMGCQLNFFKGPLASLPGCHPQPRRLPASPWGIPVNTDGAGPFQPRGKSTTGCCHNEDNSPADSPKSQGQSALGKGRASSVVCPQLSVDVLAT